MNEMIMKEIITQSIKNYNEIRPHLSCNMLTPAQMHKQNQIRIKTYKKKDANRDGLHPLVNNLIL